MNQILAAVALTILALVSPASGQPKPAQPAAGAAQSSAAPMIDGEVRKVDKEQGKLTLKHGPMPNLEMPGMTMVFRVKEPAMLEQLQPGDKVRFTADKLGGQFTVTSIEHSK